MILNQKILTLLFSALAKKPPRRHWRRDVAKGGILALGGVFILVSGIAFLVELLGLPIGFLVSGITMILVALAFPAVTKIRQYFETNPGPAPQNTLMDFVSKDPQTTLLLALSAGYLIAEVINKKHSN